MMRLAFVCSPPVLALALLIPAMGGCTCATGRGGDGVDAATGTDASAQGTDATTFVPPGSDGSPVLTPDASGEPACTFGETRPCYDGVAGTAGTGPCASGLETCSGDQEFPSWGPCEGQVLPGTETCDGTDEDCNGTLDDGCPPVTTTPTSCGPGTAPDPTLIPACPLAAECPASSTCACYCMGSGCTSTCTATTCDATASSSGGVDFVCRDGGDCSLYYDGSGGTCGHCCDGATCDMANAGSGFSRYTCETGSTCNITLEGSGYVLVDCAAAASCFVQGCMGGYCQVDCNASCQVYSNCVVNCPAGVTPVACADGSAGCGITC